MVGRCGVCEGRGIGGGEGAVRGAFQRGGCGVVRCSLERLDFMRGGRVFLCCGCLLMCTVFRDVRSGVLYI